MATIYVKTFEQMRMQNKLFYNRVKDAEERIIGRLAEVNEAESKRIADTVRFKGTLMSQISIAGPSEMSRMVIASAPHADIIEHGNAPKGDLKVGSKYYVSFNSAPLLEEWVRTKLMGKDAEKAEYFLRTGGVLVGEHGFPYTYPDGLQFMKRGFDLAWFNAHSITTEEINSLR